MLLGYLKSTFDKKTVATQRAEIIKLAKKKRLKIDKWIIEASNKSKKINNCRLISLVNKLKANDTIIVFQLSHFGRRTDDVLALLSTLMAKKIKVLSVKENCQLGNVSNWKPLSSSFKLAAEISKNITSSRIKDTLAQKKREGQILGRPKGSFSKTTKLTGKDETIKAFLSKKISIAGIARIFGVHRITVANYIKSKNLE